MPYDLSEAFEAIEDELIGSMIRNLKRHQAEETELGIQWEQWQALQLKALEEYRKNNAKKFPPRFSKLNEQIEEALRTSHSNGAADQEQKILRAIQDGFTSPKQSFSGNANIEGDFFRTNDRKLDALITATTHDMERAEYAVLRRADDQYRQVIFNAQVYANTGAGTYKKAVDMATRDFLRAGLDSIEYKNGSRHTIEDYADMAIRTAGKRAYLQGEGAMRDEWGVPTVIMNKRSCPCPKCAPFVGKVFIDDVWSGGDSSGISPVTGVKYPLLSDAIAQGLYHPRCRDVHTTYFEGVNTPPEDSQYTADELDEMAQRYEAQQKQGYCQRQEKRYDRISKYSLDEDNQRMYGARAKEWSNKAEEFGKVIESFEKSDKKAVETVEKSEESGIINDEEIFREFTNGDEANDFFFYDDDKRGLFAKRNSSHGKWLRTLSDDEKDCILDYAGGGYQDTNNYWRQRKDWKYINADLVQEKSKRLDAAISRYTLKDNIVVQRGAMEDVLDQLFEKYETPDDYSGWIGKKFVEQGYMSTTVLKDNPVATAKPVVFNIQVPAGKGVGAYINEPSLTGFNDTEYEFLIKRNSTFTITGVNENIETGEFIIDMRLDV